MKTALEDLGHLINVRESLWFCLKNSKNNAYSKHKKKFVLFVWYPKLQYLHKLKVFQLP